MPTAWRPTESFVKSLSKLDRKKREATLKAIQKFEHNPWLPGLRLKKMGGFDNLWSMRVDINFRILLARQDAGEEEVWVFDYVGPHDDYRAMGR